MPEPLTFFLLVAFLVVLVAQKDAEAYGLGLDAEAPDEPEPRDPALDEARWLGAFAERGLHAKERSRFQERASFHVQGSLAGAELEGTLLIGPQGHVALELTLPVRLPGRLLVAGRGAPRPSGHAGLRRLELACLLEGYELRGDALTAQRDLLDAPPVRAALEGLRGAGLLLSESRLQVRTQTLAALDPASLLGLLEALVRGLEQGMLQPWQAPAAQTGLPVALNEVRAPGLKGELQGHDVQVSHHDGDTLIVTALLPMPLPWSTRIAAPGRRYPVGRALRPTEVPNPVLRMFVKAWSLKPEVAQALLAPEALTGPMMAVLHGRPGSEVLDDRVLLREPMAEVEPARIRAAVSDAVELAVALSESAAQVRRQLKA